MRCESIAFYAMNVSPCAIGRLACKRNNPPHLVDLLKADCMTQPDTLPFSKARIVGDLVYLSGELPVAPGGSIPDGIEAQTARVIRRLEETLQSEGLALCDVVSVTAYLVNPADFAAFNRAYAVAFVDPRPVRTTVRADLMRPGALLELTVVAGRR